MKKIYASAKERRRAYYVKYRDQHLKKARERRKANPGRYKIYNWRVQLKRHYGMTEADFAKLWNQQGGLCAICACEMERGLKTHIDHDHDTGAVRGLLCNLCNAGLGMFRDDAARLSAAVRYLTDRNVVA